MTNNCPAFESRVKL